VRATVSNVWIGKSQEIEWGDDVAVPTFFKDGFRVVIENAPSLDATLEVLGVKTPAKRTTSRKPRTRKSELRG